MKKCPFCAEKIQDEAIVCRYCGRNLPPDKYATNAVKTANSQQTTRDLDTQPLHLEELAALFKLAKQSYPTTPDETWKTITGNLQKLVKDDCLPLLTKLVVAKKIAGDKQLQQEIEGLYSIAAAWAISCLTLGVEHGYGFATLDEAYRYPFVISQPFCLYIGGYLHLLTELRKLSEPESVRESERIASKIVKTSIQLVKMGIDGYRTVIPAAPNKESEFLHALREYPFINRDR